MSAYVYRRGEYEHRVVAAEMLGRPLAPGEVVHHRNGDGKDNRPENLQVLSSQAEHVRLHFKDYAISDEELTALLIAGRSQRELRALGASTRRLFRLRRELGVPKGSPRLSIEAGTFTRRRPYSVDVDEATRLREEGLTYRQIADRIGVSHTGVRLALRAKGR